MAWNTAPQQPQGQFQNQQQQVHPPQVNPQFQQQQQFQRQPDMQQYQPPNPPIDNALAMTQASVKPPANPSVKPLKVEEMDKHIARNYFETRWHPVINLEIPADLFAYCRALPIGELVTKKEFKTRGGKQVSLDYMAWTDSIDQLRKIQPTWSAGCELNEASGLPYWATPEGFIVAAFVYDTLTGRRTPSIYLATRDSRLSPVGHGIVIDSITNTMQRAIAKTIAQHVGIGWSVYAPDESIPDGSSSEMDFGMYGAVKPQPMQPALMQPQYAPQYPPMPQYGQEAPPEYSTQYQQQAPTFTRPTWGEGKMMT